MAMFSEKQYLDLYQSSSRVIKKNSAEVLNAVRDAAFEDFRRLGFPSRKVERYKYTDMSAIFEPDYGLNLNRLEIPVDPYEAFRCDVPKPEHFALLRGKRCFLLQGIAKGRVARGCYRGLFEQDCCRKP